MKYVRSAVPLLFLLAAAGSAHAQSAPQGNSLWCKLFPSWCSPGPKPPPVASVPEIDASSSAKAIALLAGALLLSAEFRRRKR